MGQLEVYQILERSDKPMSRSEIAIKGNMDPIVVSKALKKLVKSKEVSYMELDRIKVKDYCLERNINRVKQRMKIYFIS